MVQYPQQKQILNWVSVLITLAPCRTMQIYKVPLRITLPVHYLPQLSARQAALWWTVVWWLWQALWYTVQCSTVVAGTDFTVQHRTQESLPVDALP